MSLSFRIVLCALAAIVSASGSRAWGEEEFADTESTLLVRQADLAYELADIGRAHKMPESLVAAALILHRAGVTPGNEKPEEGDAALKPASLLEEAKKMRPDDKSLADIIARAADELKEKSRGVVGGPRSFSIRLTGSQTWKFKAEAKKPIIVTARGTTERQTFPPKPSVSAPLMIELFDAKGKKLGANSGTGFAQAGYAPPVAMEITVKVSTSAKGAVSGVLMTN